MAKRRKKQKELNDIVEAFKLYIEDSAKNENENFKKRHRTRISKLKSSRSYQIFIELYIELFLNKFPKEKEFVEKQNERFNKILSEIIKEDNEGEE